MKIIFVYNAKSGLKHSVLDSVHKIISPSTYPCNLCALTHDTFSEKSLWREFQKDFLIEMRFLHSDEFESSFHSEQFQYPTILQLENNTLIEIISSEEINNMKDLQALIHGIKTLNLSV
ncbi:GTPase [Paucihalobacter sp.]|uniref:GTPase n=1 Tax=Paucihalobacter sp. TaxID=2850405 RepID=UPI002FE1208D